MTDLPPIDSSVFKQFERGGFNRVAERYDQAIAQVTAQINEAILDAVKVGRNTRLLDVACGTGWLCAAASERQAAIAGLDLSENMITLARARCPEAKFYQGDAENLPFESGEFDGVVCSLGILHFPNPEQAIAEAFRVLKLGGCYAFTCWTPPTRNPFMNIILGSVQTHGTMDLNLPTAPPLFRFGDASECQKVLIAEGFTSVSVTELPIIWSFSKLEDVIPTIVASTARLGAILAMQSEEQRCNIEQAIIEAAKKYATNDGVEIPASVVLAVASKPQAYFVEKE